MDEQLAVEDGVNVEVSRALSTSELDQTWVCDYDGARMNVVRRQEFDGKQHEVRECGANPQHVKIAQV